MEGLDNKRTSCHVLELVSSLANGTLRRALINKTDYDVELDSYAYDIKNEEHSLNEKNDYHLDVLAPSCAALFQDTSIFGRFLNVICLDCTFASVPTFDRELRWR